MKDTNALKFLFVAVMLLVTFWTRSGRTDTSEIYAAAVAKEEVTTPTVVNTVAEFAAPPEEMEVASTSIPQEEPKPLPVERAPVISPLASVARPLIYPKTNFDVRANALHDIVTGRLAAFAIADISTSDEVYSEGATKHWPIASITKLMTAIVATEKIGISKKVTISQNAADTPGSATNLFTAGQVFTVDDLLMALLQISRNDAAVALAESYGMDGFIAEMNAKALRIGMRDTRFSDPIGLSASNVSTPVDLEKLISYIYKNEPQILKTTRESAKTIKEVTSGRNIPLPNENRNEFVGESNFLGGKTGLIDESGGNLLTVFSVSKHPILIIILGSDNYNDRFEITTQLLSWLTDNYAITASN